MSKSRIVLARILEVVSQETDIPVADIMSRCSEAEVVDARWICVKLLREHGYYSSRIGELMSITPRYVQYILTDFDDRIFLNSLMRTNYERAKKRLGNICETTD
ncbi:MAG: hypothetical protein NC095_06290 [Muribaculum sp.]|nr:hypothetical protein [Muribaculum sp.]